MSDDIYDYFGGGGTREVEPIEDDDSGEYQQGLGQEQPVAEQGQGTESGDEVASGAAPADDDIFAAFSGNSRSSDSPAHRPTAQSSSHPDSGAPSTASREVRSKTKRPKKEPGKVAKPVAASAAKEEKPAKKSGGNWDFLANVLGLSGSKQTKSAQAPSDEQDDSPIAEVVAADAQRDNQSKKDKVSTPPPVSTEKAPDAEKPSESADEAPGEFFGFNFDSADPTKIKPVGKPARGAKREPVVESADSASTQKSAPGDPDDGSGLSDDDDIFSAFAAPASKSQPVQTARSDEESDDQSVAEVNLSGHDIVTDDDFVEFEIEELDNSEVDPKAEAARGRRRRNPNSRGRGADAPRSGGETVDQPARQNTRSRRRSGKGGTNEDALTRSPRSQNEGRGRRNRSAQKDSFELDSPTNKQRPSKYGQSDSADDSDSIQDDFGTGILDDIDPRDIDPRNGGVDSPDQGRGSRGGRGRKRRSRGGRGKNRSRDEATNEFAKELKSDDADDRWNNPEPELGWDDQFEASDSSDSDGDFENDSSPRQQRGSGRQRSQGGRGRSNRGRRPRFSDDDQEVVSRSKHDSDDSWPDNFDDDGDRDFEQSETQSNERSGRRKRRPGRDRADSDQSTSRSPRPSGDRDRDDRDRGARSHLGRRRQTEDDVPSVPRYGDVPTWDDTISSVISQNMKSNGRSGGRGRGGRARSGGSRGGSGGNDRSRNARSGSDRNRGGGQDSNGRNGPRRNRR